MPGLPARRGSFSQVHTRALLPAEEKRVAHLPRPTATYWVFSGRSEDVIETWLRLFSVEFPLPVTSPLMALFNASANRYFKVAELGMVLFTVKTCRNGTENGGKNGEKLKLPKHAKIA